MSRTERWQARIEQMRDWMKPRALFNTATQVLLMAAVLVMTVLGLLRIPQAQADLAVARGEATRQQRPELENEYRRTLLQITGGLVVAVGLYLTYRRIKASEAANAIAEEGQVTERFTRAIEQLGSPELAIRLGGIYALERIARDSEADHWTVMEVLSAFLRENATRENNDPLFVADEPGEIVSSQKRIDIQAALAVIGRRISARDIGRARMRVDLREVWLIGYDLGDLDLSRAILDDAHLEHACLVNAKLSGAWFRRAFLDRACLYGAELDRADFTGASLQGARFIGENIKGSQSQGSTSVFVGAIISQLPFEDWMPDPRQTWPPPGYYWSGSATIPLPPAPEPDPKVPPDEAPTE